MTGRVLLAVAIWVAGSVALVAVLGLLGHRAYRLRRQRPRVVVVRDTGSGRRSRASAPADRPDEPGDFSGPRVELPDQPVSEVRLPETTQLRLPEPAAAPEAATDEPVPVGGGGGGSALSVERTTVGGKQRLVCRRCGVSLEVEIFAATPEEQPPEVAAFLEAHTHGGDAPDRTIQL